MRRGTKNEPRPLPRSSLNALRRRRVVLAIAVALVCFASFAAYIVGHAIDHLEVVTAGRPFVSPNGHWQVRFVSYDNLGGGGWTDAEARPANNWLAEWHELGEYDDADSLTWRGDATAILFDVGNKRAVDVAAAYGRPWYDSPLGPAREAGALFFSLGLGGVLGLSVLACGLALVFVVSRAVTRRRIRQAVGEVIACLRQGDAWGASLVYWNGAARDAAVGSPESRLRESELAHLCSSGAAHVAGIRRSRAWSGWAYRVRVAFEADVQGVAKALDLTVANTGSDWRLLPDPLDDMRRGSQPPAG